MGTDIASHNAGARQYLTENLQGGFRPERLIGWLQFGNGGATCGHRIHIPIRLFWGELEEPFQRGANISHSIGAYFVDGAVDVERFDVETDKSSLRREPGL